MNSKCYVYSEHMVYSEPCQTTEMELFANIVNDLTIFTKSSILDFWQGSEYATVTTAALEPLRKF